MFLGPVDDSHLCGVSGCGPERINEIKNEYKPTNNHNKLLGKTKIITIIINKIHDRGCLGDI